MTQQVNQLPIPAPQYNAVKIDIHNPSVNVPNNQPQMAAAPAPSAYDMPKASAYEMPQQSVYGPQTNFNQPPAAQETIPSPVQVPAPVIVPPQIVQAPVTPPPAPAVEAKPEAPAAAPAPVAQAPVAPVEVKAPEADLPKVDVNAFAAQLKDADYDVQAKAMESMAELAEKAPAQATELLDENVINSLLGIMEKDSSQLTGPTENQLAIREKIIAKQPVTPEEEAEANKISPMEQAERNKSYSMYTTAILQKLYASEIEKMHNTVVPMTELPGAVGIVEQLKTNQNPMVRATAVDALSYIQHPQYKQDLTTLFTIAQKDQDANVKEAATKALENLAKI